MIHDGNGYRTVKLDAATYGEHGYARDSVLKSIMMMAVSYAIMISKTFN